MVREVRHSNNTPPYNLTVYWGYKNVALNKETLHFLVANKVAIDLYNWLLDTYIPDESFYATAVRSKNVNGTGYRE